MNTEKDNAVRAQYFFYRSCMVAKTEKMTVHEFTWIKGRVEPSV